MIVPFSNTREPAQIITNEDEKENFACGEHKQRKFIGVLNFSSYSIASEKTEDLTCCKFIKMKDNYLESNVKVLPKY